MLVENYYRIIEFETDEQGQVAVIELNSEHEIYQGHFPGQPVVPGVMQLQIIKELLEKATGRNLFLTGASFVKYLNMIDPNVNGRVTVVIKLVRTEADHLKVNASITASDTVFTKLKGTFSYKF